MNKWKHCPHVHIRGIYGDEIIAVGWYRLECLDCGQLLDGPVSLSRVDRTGERVYTGKMTNLQQPTVGRNVHFQHDNVTMAAIVTEIPELLSEQPNEGPEGYVKAVHLVVFSAVGFVFVQQVPYSEKLQNGHWSWPSRS